MRADVQCFIYWNGFRCETGFRNKSPRPVQSCEILDIRKEFTVDAFGGHKLKIFLEKHQAINFNIHTCFKVIDINTCTECLYLVRPCSPDSPNGLWNFVSYSGHIRCFPVKNILNMLQVRLNDIYGCICGHDMYNKSHDNIFRISKKWTSRKERAV